MTGANIRIIGAVLAISLFSGCAAAPKNDGSALVGEWASPNAKANDGYSDLTLNPNGTGVGVYKHEENTPYVAHSNMGDYTAYKTVVSEKKNAILWHADDKHLWLNIKGQPKGTEVEYSLDGKTLRYTTLDGTMTYVMEREG